MEERRLKTYENIFRNYWSNISITHLNHHCRIDCNNPYWRVYSRNTLLGLVDIRFHNTPNSYNKTNRIYTMNSKLRVSIRGLLIFFFRDNNILYYENDRKEMRNMKTKKRGTFGLIVDFLLTIFTGGLWLIWLIINYLRNH